MSAEDAGDGGTSEKPARGRPKLDDDQRRDDFIKIRASAAEKAKFEALGGTAWFRPILKRAKVKP